MLLYILKKSGKKHTLIAAPDRILRLIFNDVNDVFIEKNWHKHKICSLDTEFQAILDRDCF
jgi:hypothetical protein